MDIISAQNQIQISVFKLNGNKRNDAIPFCQYTLYFISDLLNRVVNVLKNPVNNSERFKNCAQNDHYRCSSAINVEVKVLSMIQQSPGNS